MKSKHRLADYVPLQLLDDWLAEALPRAMDALERRRDGALESFKLEIIERIVRVEEGIKTVNDRIDMLLHQMDKRFEQMDKRFSSLRWTIGIGFTVIVALMSLYQFIK